MSEPSRDAQDAPGDAVRLRRLAQLAAQLDLPGARQDALAAATRTIEGQFYVACVGQFKRGKSTLINALIDDELLPTGIVPVTAVPTVVRYGDRRLVRVHRQHQDDWSIIAPDDLPTYVSEEHNPGNRLGVLAVEAFVPSPLLHDGMCFVDTPGIGSVFEANTAATRAFIPHIDAALAVIGADPPVSGDELDLIERVAQQVERVIVVLNKADRVSDEERAVAGNFARTVIERRIHRPVAIHAISATERLATHTATRDWNMLVGELQTLASQSGRAIVANSARRAVDRIATVLQQAIDDERAALQRSHDENAEHLAALNAIVADAERALLDLGALLGVEQQRLARQFAAERADFLRDAVPRARAALAISRNQVTSRLGPALRRTLMHAAQAAAHAELDPWLAQQQQQAEAAFRESMQRFVALGEDFLNRLVAAHPTELTALRAGVDPELALDTKSTFVFHEVITTAEPASPLRFMADLALGAVSPGVIARDADRFLAWLLEMNSSRVESDVDQRMAEGRRALERVIRTQLRDVTFRAQQALHRASLAQQAGADAIAARLTMLDQQAATLNAIREA